MANPAKEATICLCMIVKNEAHVVEECLESVAPFISYYAINDTGSTDGTQDIIRNFFKERDIPGVVVDHEYRSCQCHPEEKWKKYPFFHFGWNRTYSLELCKQFPADYILVMDADDVLHGTLDRRGLTAPSYEMKLTGGVTTWRKQLVRNDPLHNWHYREALHEHLAGDHDYVTQLPGDDCTIESRRAGARSRDPNTYRKDAAVFETLLAEDPHNARSLFYCAQSWFDAKERRRSLMWYLRRIAAGDFLGEVFYSQFKIVTCYVELLYDYDLMVRHAFNCAYMTPSRRCEPLFHVIGLYKKLGWFEEAYTISAKIVGDVPPKRELFVNEYFYGPTRDLLHATCAYKTGRFTEAKRYLHTITTGREGELAKSLMRKIHRITSSRPRYTTRGTPHNPFLRRVLSKIELVRDDPQGLIVFLRHGETLPQSETKMICVLIPDSRGEFPAPPDLDRADLIVLTKSPHEYRQYYAMRHRGIEARKILRHAAHIKRSHLAIPPR